MAVFPEGTPCWVDAALPDVAAGRRFYGELLGWTFRQENGDPYVDAYSDGKLVAALAPKSDGRMPTVWNVYFATPDAVALAGRITAEGGRLIVPPRRVGTLGAVAVAVDPGGAVFGLWQAGERAGFEKQALPGSFCWTEVYTWDSERADPFYERVFGFSGTDLTPEAGGTQVSPEEPGAPGVAGEPGARGATGVAGEPEAPEAPEEPGAMAAPSAPGTGSGGGTDAGTRPGPAPGSASAPGSDRSAETPSAPRTAPGTVPGPARGSETASGTVPGTASGSASAAPGAGVRIWSPKGARPGEETAVGGRCVLTRPAFPAELPDHFLVYFCVEDCDAAVAAAVRLGGRVQARPFDIPHGRIAVLTDNQGATFAVLAQPAAVAGTRKRPAGG
ncbi:VOC family protein [Streptomyces sp. NPDC051018]|uniref:VOC family protein n=1 Tax=Streptomyces sp. NPDC051018 TaxID=3365639 RepID=UPI003795EA06